MITEFLHRASLNQWRSKLVTIIIGNKTLAGKDSGFRGYLEFPLMRSSPQYVG